MLKNLQDIRALVRFIAGRFVQDRCTQTAASLTFTTLQSLVPMITIALTMFSAFPVFENFSVQIKTYLLNNLMPETAGVVITRYMQQFTESATRLTTVGIGFLAITAMSMMLTIDHAFNVIWRVTRPRPLVKRLVVYWAVLTLAPLLIGASLSLTSWLVGLSMGYAKNISLFGIGVLKILPVFFATLAFALLFRLVPNRYVPRSHAVRDHEPDIRLLRQPFSYIQTGVWRVCQCADLPDVDLPVLADHPVWRGDRGIAVALAYSRGIAAIIYHPLAGCPAGIADPDKRVSAGNSEHFSGDVQVFAYRL